MTASRPRRSALYMPGSNPKVLAKGRSLAADVLIFDLEDAVAPGAKAEARTNIVSALAEGGFGQREILVRVNALDTRWGRDDLDVLAQAGAHGILLPKVESADTIRETIEILDAAGGPKSLAIWCMIETPLGVLRVQEIAGASARLAGFLMGTADLAKDLHCLHTPDRLPFVTSLSLSILAARAYGLAILDGVFFDLNDLEGFTASCQQGLEFGFDGKTLIHPKTIDAANSVFGPSAEQIGQAQVIVDAFNEARAQGAGVTVLNGKLVEELHVKDAQRVLALAEQIAVLEADRPA